MSYQEALEAAGANVELFETFGSYQGEWIAKIGPNEYVMGTYGSCSGCDAFESEFGWDRDGHCEKHCYEYGTNVHETCSNCIEGAKLYQQRLADFGKTYLDTSYTKEELLKQFEDRGYIGEDDQELINWLKEH